MGGMAASVNCTSTAGPAIWMTFPIFSDIDKVSRSLVVRRSLFVRTPKGASNLEELAASLKRWPDTNPSSLKLPCYEPLLRCRSAYDFDNFFRDLRLTRAIHDQRERIDHIAGVDGCSIHRRHAGSVLSGYGLEQRTKNLYADILRQNSLEKLVGRLLVD